jgi:hypothetical protein
VKSCDESGNCVECGGALLDGGKFVLTSSTCAEGDVSVMINGELIKTRKTILHQGSDAALVKISGTDQSGICLPPSGKYYLLCLENSSY